ncbi:MAG: hypothetical protein PWQ12_1673 [Clostridiales bacterium]|jgi:hypothetical protein|nr:hypothetical protein [Clostridiales bacterium]
MFSVPKYFETKFGFKLDRVLNQGDIGQSLFTEAEYGPRILQEDLLGA